MGNGSLSTFFVTGGYGGSTPSAVLLQKILGGVMERGGQIVLRRDAANQERTCGFSTADGGGPSALYSSGAGMPFVFYTVGVVR